MGYLSIPINAILPSEIEAVDCDIILNGVDLGVVELWVDELYVDGGVEHTNPEQLGKDGQLARVALCRVRLHGEGVRLVRRK